MGEEFGYRRGRRGRPRGGFRGSGPGSLEVGEELTLRIFGVSRRGDGMGKAKGYTVFVPNTKAGDVVKVRVTRVWSRYAAAEVVGGGSAEEPAAGEEEAGEEGFTEE
jgi:predicted RNA-binding protein with TRAM domain